MPHPQKILHGVFRSRQNDHIRIFQFSGIFYIANGQSRNAFQWIKVREIGNTGQADHRNINDTCLLLPFKAPGQAVLILHLDIDIRSHAHHRNSAFFLQHFHSRIQNRLVSPELVDDQAFYHGPFLFLQKLHRADELCENAAPVNIAHQEHRRICHFCHAHIYNVFFLQIDLRRASRTLDHNDIVFRCERVVSLHNIRHQLFLIFEIISGAHGSQNLTVYDHLGANVVGRLQKNGIHKNGGLDSRRFRLHHLGSSHLQSLFCDKRIQRHILRFKGSHLIAILFKNAAQSRCKKAFARIGHSSLYHNCFCHLPYPLSISRRTEISFSFSLGLFTATR